MKFRSIVAAGVAAAALVLPTLAIAQSDQPATDAAKKSGRHAGHHKPMPAPTPAAEATPAPNEMPTTTTPPASDSTATPAPTSDPTATPQR